MMKKERIMQRLKRCKTISGVDRILNSEKYTILPPTGGDYKIWTDGSGTITVKVVTEENVGMSQTICEEYDYDVLLYKGYNENELSFIHLNENAAA